MSRLAEQLGFDPAERLAVIHADDIGMCHAANVGALEALRAGPASCGSVMVPCPWFAEVAAAARAEPALDLGVHLTLNAEWTHYRWKPVAGDAVVPSLLDDEGYLPRTMLEVAERAKPAEVAIELRAQVQGALDAGIDVTHLDSHMGTVFLPPFQEVYAELAREFRLPVFLASPDDATCERMGLGGAGPLLRGLAERLGAEGFPVLDGFDADSLGFAPGEGEAHNRERLARLPRGISYLICHPARGGEELEAICPEHAHQRDFERRFYGGEAGRAALREAGIRSIGMRPLRALLRGEPLS